MDKIKISKNHHNNNFTFQIQEKKSYKIILIEFQKEFSIYGLKFY